MSFFKLRVSFSLNFESLFSVMTNNFSNIFWLKLMYTLDRKVNVQFFRLFSALMKVHPIPHAIFILWTNRSVHRRAHQSENFRLLSGSVKIQQIPHVIFKTTSQFLFKRCITLQCNEITLLYLFSWNFIWFGEKEPIKVQNFRLTTAHLKSVLLIGSFCRNYINLHLKSTEKLCLLSLKSDAKFEEKPISC